MEENKIKGENKIKEEKVNLDRTFRVTYNRDTEDYNIEKRRKIRYRSN